jgi:hypothetical protein
MRDKMKKWGFMMIIPVIVGCVAYVSDLLPAQVFRVQVVERDIPRRQAMERAWTRVCLEPGEVVVQECSFDPRTYRARFFLCSETKAASGYAEIFLAPGSEGRTTDYGRLALDELSTSWEKMQVVFKPVENGGRFFLTIRNSPESSSRLCVQMVDPCYPWDLTGGMWKGTFSAIESQLGLGLWNFATFKHVTFRGLVYRASQYSAVKGVGLLVLMSVFFLLLVGCLREWSQLGVPARRMMVVTGAAGLLLIVCLGFPRDRIFLLSVESAESEGAVLACDAMLRSQLLGDAGDPPRRWRDVRMDISGGFEIPSQVSRLDLTTKGLRGWVALDALPEEGWLFVNDYARFPLEFGVRHAGDRKRPGAWFDFRSPFPQQYLMSESCRLGVAVKVAAGHYFKIPQAVIQLHGRVPVGRTQLLDTLRNIPSLPAKRTDALPVSGDWDGDGVSGVGYFEQETGRFLLYKNGESLYREFNLGVKGSDWWPVAGDWDGDGRTDVGLYGRSENLLVRAGEPFEKTHEVKLELSAGDGERRYLRPIAGDWNGDGRDEAGLFHLKVKLFILFSEEGSAHERFYFGAAIHSFIPLVGDWCNEGKDRVGLFNVAMRDLIVQSLYGTQVERQGPTGYPLCGHWGKGDRADTIILLTSLQKDVFSSYFGER